MWTPATRRQHSRDHLRYGSDLSDAEWAIIAPFMPPPRRASPPCPSRRARNRAGRVRPPRPFGSRLFAPPSF